MLRTAHAATAARVLRGAGRLVLAWARVPPLMLALTLTLTLALALALMPTLLPSPAGSFAGVFPAANAAAVDSARSSQRLDRSIRRISLSHHVIRIRGLAAICPQMKRVLSMNVRYADLDGDNAEDAVVEAVTCQSTDGSADLVGVYTYQHPDSVRELPAEHAVRSGDPVFAGAVGPLRLELIDGRLVRWFALEGPRCASGRQAAPGRRSLFYRWAGTGFVVERTQEIAPGQC